MREQLRQVEEKFQNRRGKDIRVKDCKKMRAEESILIQWDAGLEVRGPEHEIWMESVDIAVSSVDNSHKMFGCKEEART